MRKTFKHCPRCTLRQIRGLFVANDNGDVPSVYLPCDCEVSDPCYIARIGKALVELEMPRRQVAQWSWTVIEKFDRTGGRAYFPDGLRYDLANLPDDPFGEDEAATNVRDLMGYAVRRPARVRQECRDRARVISTALLIACGEIAWKHRL